MTVLTKYWTWAQIRTKIQTDHDIQDEVFITRVQLLDWTNEAIDMIEAVIHQKNEDYFLVQAYVALASGVDTSALPTNIYAFKVRDLWYDNGSRRYPILRLPTLKKFLQYKLARASSPSVNDELAYFVTNETPGSPKFKWSPVPQETAASYVECWYYRQANRLEVDADICDIPEFIQVVFDYLGEKIEWRRRRGSAEHASAKETFANSLSLMRTTLAGMIIDGRDEIEQDQSHYEEHN